MEKQYVTGLDIGTGSTKAITIDAKGNAVSLQQVYYSTQRPKPGYAEQDPEIIWNAFVQCIIKSVKKIGKVPEVICISSAMHSIMVADEDGELLTPLITWEDTRSEAIAEAIKNSNGESLYTDTGTPIHPMTPLCKILWLKENEPDIFAKAHKFISIKEYIWYRLFKVYEADQSIASATGLFNIYTKQWYAPSLERCGITASQLSKVVATRFIRNITSGEILNKLSVNETTKFCIGASDGCLANIGSDVLASGKAAITIGTSGAVRVTAEKPLVNYRAMIFNYLLDERYFVSGAPVNNGGNVVKWLFRVFLQNEHPSDDDYTTLFNSAGKVDAGSNGLMFLPYLNGERAPVWDGNACGVYFGIQSLHTHAHFIRAALEGICYSLKNILTILESASSSIEQLNVSGGFIHSPVWMQILADVCNKKICLTRAEDASSIGAALLGMKAAGMIDNYNDPGTQINDSMHPDAKNVAVYHSYYPIFSGLYEPLKNAMHRLREV